MTRLSLLALLLSPASLSAAEPVKKPNVVVILSDDQGWGDLSINGNRNLKTPHIDSLAHDGAKFEHFFVQPVCAPTRAEFLTGRWHPRGGVRGVSTGQERLDLSERTIADAFRAAGYSTACFGKWHNGSQYPYHPRGRGFDEYYGFTSGHWGEYFDPPLDHNGTMVKGKGYITDDLTDHAIDFVKANAAANKPFFCYLAYNTPHSPMQVPDAYWKRFEKAELPMAGGKKEDPNHTRAALAMCENIDDNVGRLLAALKEGGLEKDTIVVYFSDNGPNGQRWNGGMRGIKGSTDEGGVRSPMHLRWTGKVKPGTTVAAIAGAVDLYPTLIDLCGVKRVGDKPFDGISMAPWLLGDVGPPQRVLFSNGGKTSARDQRYRLDTDGRLYDMVDDPGQTKDIAVEKPAEVKRLAEAVAAWRQDVLAGRPPGDRPYPVGYAEFPRTWLPARDANAAGGVKRSSGAPNCSFFTDWTRPDQRITWDVDVHTPGRYEAILYYTCPENDVGSAVELAFGKTAWKGTVSPAHDPPLHGKEHDRVPHSAESYVKDFKPMSLGVIELPAGRETLTLRAIDVKGKQVADVRAVELVLIDGKK